MSYFSNHVAPDMPEYQPSPDDWAEYDYHCDLMAAARVPGLVDALRAGARREVNAAARCRDMLREMGR